MDWKKNGLLPHADEKWLAKSGASLTAGTVAPTAWRSVSLSLQYTANGRPFYFNIDPWYVGIEEAEKRITLSRYIGGNLFAACDIEIKPESSVQVDISATPSSIDILVNGLPFRYESAVPVNMTSAALYPAEGMLVSEPALKVEELIDEAALQQSGPTQKALEFTIDFYDDMQLAPFDHGMLDSMFKTIAELGGSRAYWIHHGGRGEGLWEEGPGSVNMARTFDQVGDDYLPAAVKAAHRAGLPLIAIMKPFDTAAMHRSAPESPGKSGARALGGRIERSAKFPAAHPELCRQAASVTQEVKPVRRIVLRSRHDLPAEAAQDIEIYLSSDNVTYIRYDKAFSVEVGERELLIDGLDFDQPFFALHFSDKLAPLIENTLPLLAGLLDAEGNAAPFTWGICPRVCWRGQYHLGGYMEQMDFQTHGLNFDCAGVGVPSAVWNSAKTLLELYSPSRSGNVLAFALGINPQVPGVLSEAEPMAQAYWLSKIENMLDAGVDGVDIRIMNHSNIIDWAGYGFNAPLVERYRERYGVDIRSQEFSPEKLRQLRGEFFTEFLRAASDLVRSRGKKFHLHLEDTAQGSAAEPCPMEIAMPWRQWIEEGICDGVTLKALNTFSHDTAFGREVMARCRAKGIPVSFSSFIHSTFSEENHQEILQSHLSSRCEALNVYEFATLFEFSPSGDMKIVDERMTDWIKAYAWKRPA